MGEWVLTEPGVLAWTGTPFSIRYRGGEKKAFALYQDANFLEANETLDFTKLMAKWRHEELVEMGVLCAN